MMGRMLWGRFRDELGEVGYKGLALGLLGLRGCGDEERVGGAGLLGWKAIVLVDERVVTSTPVSREEAREENVVGTGKIEPVLVRNPRIASVFPYV